MGGRFLAIQILLFDMRMRPLRYENAPFVFQNEICGYANETFYYENEISRKTVGLLGQKIRRLVEKTALVRG